MFKDGLILNTLDFIREALLVLLALMACHIFSLKKPFFNRELEVIWGVMFPDYVYECLLNTTQSSS